jgi:hypothetical protein
MRSDNQWLFRIKHAPVGPKNLILEKILDDRNNSLTASNWEKVKTKSKSFRISLIKKGQNRRPSGLRKKV